MHSQPEIQLSPAAKAQVLKLLKQTGKENAKLRVYIIGGGCSGFQYGFKLDELVNADDTLIEIDASSMQDQNTEDTQTGDGKTHLNSIIQVVIDALSFQYLMGSEIDYVVNLQGARYAVKNPNAETTCGCGSSFSLKEE